MSTYVSVSVSVSTSRSRPSTDSESARVEPLDFMIFTFILRELWSLTR